MGHELCGTAGSDIGHPPPDPSPNRSRGLLLSPGAGSTPRTAGPRTPSRRSDHGAPFGGGPRPQPRPRHFPRRRKCRGPCHPLKKKTTKQPSRHGHPRPPCALMPPPVGGGGGTEEGALTAPWPVPRSQTCETLSYTPKTVSRPTTPRLPLCLTSLSFSLVEGGGACGWSREGEGGAMGALRDGGA